MRNGLGFDNKVRLIRHLSVSFILATLAALIIAGCSDDGIAPMTTDLTEDNISFFDLPWTDDALAKRNDIVEADVSFAQLRLQAAVGGLIPLGDNPDDESFVVLPGSFLADTTFTVEITRITTNTGEMPVVYEFGPDGLVFDRPAVLRLDLGVLCGKRATAIDFYWLDESSDEWVYQDTYEADDFQIVYVPIEHFSSFSWGQGAGTTAD